MAESLPDGKAEDKQRRGIIKVNPFLFYPKKAIEHGLKGKIFRGFSSEWASFIIQNRRLQSFHHDYDIVVGPVADAFVDVEIEKHLLKYGSRFLEAEALRDFAKHISQFGNGYVQYCFCTDNALKELIRE